MSNEGSASGEPPPAAEDNQPTVVHAVEPASMEHTGKPVESAELASDGSKIENIEHAIHEVATSLTDTPENIRKEDSNAAPTEESSEHPEASANNAEGSVKIDKIEQGMKLSEKNTQLSTSEAIEEGSGADKEEIRIEETPEIAEVLPEITSSVQHAPEEKPKKSKLDLMKEERQKKAEITKAKHEKEKQKKEKDKLKARKKKKGIASSSDVQNETAQELSNIRQNISAEILYKRFSGYAHVCARQGSIPYNLEKWHRRYIELHYREIQIFTKKPNAKDSDDAPRRSFFLAKGTKVKLMQPKSEESAYCFEILIGRTSKRFWLALPTFEIMESWLYALREFIPSVMSLIRGLRAKLMGTTDEALQEFTPAEIKGIKNNIAKLFLIVKPKHSGNIAKDELLWCIENDENVQMLMRSDPALTLLLDISRYSIDFLSMDSDGDGTVNFEELLHFCGILRSRTLDRKNLTVRLFKLIDADNNGDIDKEELMLAIVNKPEVVLHLKNSGALKGLLHPRTYQKTFASMDTNNDGVISLEEMLSFVDRYTNGAKRRRMAITRLFEVIDIDNGGTLDQAEFVKAIKENPVARALIEAESTLRPILEQENPEDIFKDMDKDGDGDISLEELLMWCSVEDDNLQADVWHLMRAFVLLTEKEKPPPEASLVSLAYNGAPGYLINHKSLLRHVIVNPSTSCRNELQNHPKLIPLLSGKLFRSTVLAMLGSWSSGDMSFEEFSAFCKGVTLDSKHVRKRSSIHISNVEGPAAGRHGFVKDTLFKAHVDDTRKEEAKFVRNTKLDNRARLKEARAEREKREASIATALQAEAELKAEIERKRKEVERAEEERKRAQKLYAAQHKAHDHKLVTVGPVGGKIPYCVECRRIAWEYKVEKARLDEMDRVVELAAWVKKNKEEEKAMEKSWKLLEEALQRQEQKEKMKFDTDIEKQKRRFKIRKELGLQGKSEEDIEEELRRSEPRMYQGKAAAVRQKQNVTVDDSLEAIREAQMDGIKASMLFERAGTIFKKRIKDRVSVEKNRWKNVLKERQIRFREETKRHLEVRRHIEEKEAAGEKIRTSFDGIWDKEKELEAIRRPPEDRETRRQNENRATFLEIVSRLRTRGRISRLLWQRTLANNGSTSTHHVYDTSRDKHYIMKVVPCSTENEVATMMDDTFLQRRVASECPYCVNVDDCFYHAVTGFGGGFYMVIILYECGMNGELADRVFDPKKPINDDQGLEWIGQMARGLQQLHDNQFVHRNVRPQNIFLSSKDIAMVGGYPVAKTFEATLPIAATYTGGPTYLAPELLDEARLFPGVVAPPIDVWALGCTIYYMCTGKEVCLTASGDLPVTMHKLLDGIPVRFETTIREVIRMSLVHDIDERATLEEIIATVDAEQAKRQNAKEAEIRHTESVTKLFHRVDKDGGGSIEMEELMHSIKTDKWVTKLLARNERLQPFLQPERVKKQFAMIDKDRDGLVTLEELLEFTKILSHGGNHEPDVLNAIVKIFNIVDRNNMMVVPKEKFILACKSRPDVRLLLEGVKKLQPLLEVSNFQHSLMKLETDEDGILSMDEAIAYADNLYEENLKKMELKAQRKAEKKMARKLAMSFHHS
jgi:Ca2+-binding EF-hand superfamily protein